MGLGNLWGPNRLFLQLFILDFLILVLGVEGLNYVFFCVQYFYMLLGIFTKIISDGTKIIFHLFSCFSLVVFAIVLLLFIKKQWKSLMNLFNEG